MPDARSLFKRHINAFNGPSGQAASKESEAIIYAACILAEAIRNEQEQVDMRIIEPQKEPA